MSDKLILIVFSVFFLLTSCEKDQLPNDYTIDYGQTIAPATIDFNLTFTDVLEDSRCPADAICVWEGQVRVQLSASRGDQVDSVELIYREGYTELARVDYRGHRIELLKVIPEVRYFNVSYPLEDYKLEIRIE